MMTLTRARLHLPAGTILVPALLAGAAVLSLAGVADLRALVFTAAVVLAVLLGSRANAARVRRERAVQLIADGRADVPMAAVEREARRLRDPRRVFLLARSLDALRLEARAPYRDRRTRPLYVPGVIREVDAEVAMLARLMRAEPPRAGLAATARAERLLGDAESPLYGDDPRRLREEIARVVSALGG
jgi:hypothetical protein